MMTAADLGWLAFAMLVPAAGVLGLGAIILGAIERRGRLVFAGLLLCSLCTGAVAALLVYTVALDHLGGQG
ncbi:hypothetical protein [Plastoroseomonas hellenica]|uniref:NADH-quinone oxidoreductase subunit L n=1 Tax=Plastoroseomonas hellenica TaxID=2687306 RepID=A0ABS5F7E2_9PROT|nr:hypothetical protein [Plastoroseomonas hellenica]MBR0646933.1 hypothetical protein [Plastoroseomonas hellenica]MBR0668496.1 hypothetical protein [Plastoroseomonas hellenica]